MIYSDLHAGNINENFVTNEKLRTEFKNWEYSFNVFHVRALYYTKTLITNKCTKRVYHQS
jgi:hypothetical protein